MDNVGKRHAWVQFSVLMIAIVAVCEAHAQDGGFARADNRVIEEIVVTARKKEETLQDAPVLITAFSREQIEQQNINGLDELAAFTPGLQTGEQTGSNGGSVFLRGIGNAMRLLWRIRQWP